MWLILIIAAIGIEAFQYHALTSQGLMRDDFCWLSMARDGLSDPTIIFSRFISGFFRPVVHVSFISTYAIFGSSAMPYYLTNILIDLLCALALGRLAFEITRSRIAALSGVIMFATHPQHAEVVAWVSARTSSLMTLFGLATLIAWLQLRRTGRWRFGAATLLAYAVALGSKEEAAILLPVLIALDLLIARQEARESGAKSTRFACHATMAACSVLFGLYLYAQYAFQSAGSIATTSNYELHGGVFAQCGMRVLRLFVHRHVAPTGLAIGAACGLCVVAACILRNDNGVLRRAAAFGLVLSLFAALPTSFFRDPVYPMRYDYFASCGSALVWSSLAAGGWALISNKSAHRLVRGLATAMIGMIAITVPIQIHHLKRSMREFQRDAVAGGRTHQAVRALAGRLTDAQTRNQKVRLINPPLPPLDMQCLCHLEGGIPLADVAPVYSTGEEPPPDDHTIVIQWPEEGR